MTNFLNFLAQAKPTNCNPDSNDTNCMSVLPRVSANQDAVQQIMSIFFGVIAAVAVLVIVIAAINFAGSEGDPEKISRAKKTIIYALIGLIIALSAEAIVFLVMGNL